MSGMFLDAVELAAITGYKRKSHQIKWLKERRYKFEISSYGHPIVHRDHHAQKTIEPEQISHEKMMARSLRAARISKEEIISSRFLAARVSGIYFLIKNHEIIYIGQSMNILSRLGSHSIRVDFDYYSFIECEREQLCIVESRLIKKFKPALNIHLK